MIQTRCKFQVQEVARIHWNCAAKGEAPKFAERIKMQAVCSDEDKENVSFSSATPTGNLEFTVSNPIVVGTMEPGSFYYLDLIPVPPKA